MGMTEKNETLGEVSSSRKYVAIIGDLVRSRELQERGATQARLREGIDQANGQFVTQVAARFILTIGDEFQGLLYGVDELVPLLAVLRIAIHPIEQRIGIGVGPLDTRVEEIALGMDGPCFHRARSAIERAKAQATPIEVETGGQDQPFRIYSLLYAGLRRGWTARQREVVDLSLAGRSGKEIANVLDISPSAVSQHLRAAEAGLFQEATDVWFNSLRTVYTELE